MNNFHNKPVLWFSIMTLGLIIFDEQKCAESVFLESAMHAVSVDFVQFNGVSEDKM